MKWDIKNKYGEKIGSINENNGSGGSGCSGCAIILFFLVIGFASLITFPVFLMNILQTPFVLFLILILSLVNYSFSKTPCNAYDVIAGESVIWGIVLLVYYIINPSEPKTLANLNFIEKVFVWLGTAIQCFMSGVIISAITLFIVSCFTKEQ